MATATARDNRRRRALGTCDVAALRQATPGVLAPGIYEDDWGSMSVSSAALATRAHYFHLKIAKNGAFTNFS
tara:strand:- start:1012 stop:1227 length:216 start_codon:yes stop_codon:yes gene_type:complete